MCIQEGKFESEFRHVFNQFSHTTCRTGQFKSFGHLISMPQRQDPNRFAVLQSHDTDPSEEAVDSGGMDSLSSSMQQASLGDRKTCEQAAGSTQQAAAQQQQQANLRSSRWQPLFWVDCEMSGLDLSKDVLIEIACLITDGNISKVVEGPEIAIHQPDSVLTNMNEWSQEHHAASGLTQRSRDSKVSLRQAEDQVLAFLQEHIPKPGTAVLAGNTVHMDLAFLRIHMPRVVEHLHYRIVDVSSVSELCKRWLPKVVAEKPRKQNCHTAMADIKESVEELKFYKRHCFKP